MSAMFSYQDGFKTNYTYDAKNQLTGAANLAIAGLTPAVLPANESYSLDSTGNRKAVGGARQSATGTQNQLQTDGVYNYQYDAEGNQTRRTKISDGTYTTYQWNHRDQLQIVRDFNASGVLTGLSQFDYDAFGRRVIDFRDSNCDATWDQYDRWFNDGENRVIQARDCDGATGTLPVKISNRFLHGDTIDHVLADENFQTATGPNIMSTNASTAMGVTLWTVEDQLGSARDLVDNNGIIRKHVIYDSFGNRLSETNRDASGAVLPALSSAAIDFAFGYTGADYDPDTNLTNYGAR